MDIQWYPGHMNKARRLVEQNLKLVDVVVELLDARAPASSRNPVINEIIGNKPRVIILNKADLADREVSGYWLKEMNRRGMALAVNSQKGEGMKKVPPAIEKMSGRKTGGRPVRCMVLGIPNVGKSIFINVLAKRKVTRTGNKPGVTKGQQWIKVGNRVQLLDTPGILWPKFEDPGVAFRLAVIGAIKEEVYSVEDVVAELISWLEEHYPQRWRERYGLSPGLTPPEIMESVGRLRGFFLPGGKVDINKAAVHILKEFREGKLGLFTLDLPPYNNRQ